MLGFLELFGFPPSPLGGVCLLVISLIWAINARRKLKPYWVALQVAIVSSITARVLTYVFQSDGDSVGFVAFVTSLTIGKIMMYWLISWLIVTMVFLIRARNDSANIFTRNRNK